MTAKPITVPDIACDEARRIGANVAKLAGVAAQNF
jgi:hypothetical protein